MVGAMMDEVVGGKADGDGAAAADVISELDRDLHEYWRRVHPGEPFPGVAVEFRDGGHVVDVVDFPAE